MDLLYKPLAEFQEELLPQDVPLRTIFNIYDDHEQDRQRMLVCLIFIWHKSLVNKLKMQWTWTVYWYFVTISNQQYTDFRHLGVSFLGLVFTVILLMFWTSGLLYLLVIVKFSISSLAWFNPHKQHMHIFTFLNKMRDKHNFFFFALPSP